MAGGKVNAIKDSQYDGRLYFRIGYINSLVGLNAKWCEKAVVKTGDAHDDVQMP